MSSPKKVVVIDDERNILATLEALLTRRGFAPQMASTGAQGRRVIAEYSPDLVLLDIGLPDVNGLDLLSELRAAYATLPIIVLTAHDSLENAITAIKSGAFHFFSKPYVPEELISLCFRAIEQGELSRETSRLREQTVQLERKLRETEELLGPVAASRQMREIEQMVSRVAPSTANVLITGESGVGKEVIATEIHKLSWRKDGPLVKLNCGAFPPNMIESELFGYTKGAFTGAVTSFPGMIAESSGGTLFLDEVTEMPPELQTRFLRVLQEREYRSLGSTKMVAADFRLVAATNREPAKAVQDGVLRQDLYFRLKTFQIEIPPLRERRDDIPRLVDLFLKRFATQNKTVIPRIDPPAMQTFMDYPWPGNVRELQNAIEHSLILSEDGVILEKHLPRELRLPVGVQAALETARNSAPATTLEEVEKRALVEALSKTGGNKKRAAELLGIHRPTLYAKLRRFGLT